MFFFLININSYLKNDLMHQGQIFFQDPASVVMEGLIDLHDHIFFFLIITFFVVFYNLNQIVKDFRIYSYDLDPMNMRNYVQSLNFKHGILLEIVWTIIPTFVLIFIAIPSFSLLYSMDEIIDPSLTLKVIGHQWYWSYEYSDNYNIGHIDFDSYLVPEENLESGDFRLLEVDNQVILPTKQHIRFIVTGADVLHCWAVPSLGIKIDAVPGRLNQVSTYIKREGFFYGQCSEICGVNHGYMPIVIHSVNTDIYLLWLHFVLLSLKTNK